MKWVGGIIWVCHFELLKRVLHIAKAASASAFIDCLNYAENQPMNFSCNLCLNHKLFGHHTQFDPGFFFPRLFELLFFSLGGRMDNSTTLNCDTLLAVSNIMNICICLKADSRLDACNSNTSHQWWTDPNDTALYNFGFTPILHNLRVRKTRQNRAWIWNITAN